MNKIERLEKTHEVKRCNQNSGSYRQMMREKINELVDAVNILIDGFHILSPKVERRKEPECKHQWRCDTKGATCGECGLRNEEKSAKECEHEWTFPSPVAVCKKCNLNGYHPEELGGEGFETVKKPRRSKPAHLPTSVKDELADTLNGALARGYCWPCNSNKVLDSELIYAMSAEVRKWAVEVVEKCPFNPFDKNEVVKRLMEG